ALDGVDAVISAIGPRGRKDGPVASTATRGILLALADTGVRRFVALSAAPAGPVPADDSWLNRRILLPFVGALLRDTYVDRAARPGGAGGRRFIAPAPRPGGGPRLGRPGVRPDAEPGEQRGAAAARLGRVGHLDRQVERVGEQLAPLWTPRAAPAQPDR